MLERRDLCLLLDVRDAKILLGFLEFLRGKFPGRSSRVLKVAKKVYIEGKETLPLGEIDLLKSFEESRYAFFTEVYTKIPKEYSFNPKAWRDVMRYFKPPTEKSNMERLFF